MKKEEDNHIKVDDKLNENFDHVLVEIESLTESINKLE